MSWPLTHPPGVPTPEEEALRALIQSEPFRTDALWLKTLMRVAGHRPELVEQARARLADRYGPELAAAMIEWEEA